MTSGNRSDEPIAIDDDEARARLGGIADVFLAHDRPIHRRCEDSVVRRRRSPCGARAATPPAPRHCRSPRQRPLVAAGAELKSTFCVARGSRRVPLAAPRRPRQRAPPTRAFRTDLALYLDMLGVEPRRRRPRPASRLPLDALRLRAGHSELVDVQHHHAHAAACIAEHGETEPVLARRARRDRLRHRRDDLGRRVPALRPRRVRARRTSRAGPAAGGEAAVREPWRCGVVPRACGRPVPCRALGARPPEPARSTRRSRPARAALRRGRRAARRPRARSATRARRRSSSSTSPATARPGRTRARSTTDDPGADLVAAAHDDLAAGRPGPRSRPPSTRVSPRRSRRRARRRPARRHGSPLRRLPPEPAAARLAPHGSSRAASGCSPTAAGPPNDGGVSYGQAAVGPLRGRACA